LGWLDFGTERPLEKVARFMGKGEVVMVEQPRIDAVATDASGVILRQLEDPAPVVPGEFSGNMEVLGRYVADS